MTPGIRTKAPSRQNKKQVIAFLRPNQAEAAYSKAAREDKTNQEVIGESLNAVFTHYGVTPPVPAGHRRIVRRATARAALRDEISGPRCRSGKVAYSGWFDDKIVKELHDLSSRFSISVQSIIELGIHLVTGVAPGINEEHEEEPKEDEKVAA